VIADRESHAALHRFRGRLPRLFADGAEGRPQGELLHHDLGAQPHGRRHQPRQPLVTRFQVSREGRPPEECEDLRRDADREEIVPVDGQERQDVVGTGVTVAVPLAVERDRRFQLIAQVIDVALDRLGRDRKELRERGRVGEAPLLDLVVDRLETPPERPILERPRAAHGKILWEESVIPSPFLPVIPSLSLPVILSEAKDLCLSLRASRSCSGQALGEAKDLHSLLRRLSCS
jgi:hypothetical protein